MSDKVKFLILNPSPDNLIKILEKSNAQYTKNGPFEATILLGDVLPQGYELPNVKPLGVTYFSRGANGISEVIQAKESSTQSSIDLATNFTFVKPPFSVIRTTSGITIMIVSKLDTNNESEEKPLDLPEVKIDILITYEWPQVIGRLCKLTTVGNDKINELVTKLKPRYHFAVGNEIGKFFELEPFAWSTGEITRFISLAQEGGSKEKWFYAFSIGLEQDKNTNVIENPFTATNKRSRDGDTNKDEEKELSNAREVKKSKVVAPEQCFFCLSNPNTETHMIVSIGTCSYLTIAKGPLTRSNKNLQFSGHGILIPIEHTPTIKQESLVSEELLKYQNSLVTAFDEQKPNLKLVFWEINRDTNIHYHKQFLPVEESLLNKFSKSLDMRVKLNNEKFKKNQNLHFTKFTDMANPELTKILDTSNYIMFTVCKNKTDRDYYIAPLIPEKSIDIQFPRRVLAHVLNLPDRIHWDKCQQPKLKEMADCENFKSFYQKFDFTL